MTTATASRTRVRKTARVKTPKLGTYLLQWSVDGKNFETEYLAEGLTANQAQRAFYAKVRELKEENPRRRKMQVMCSMTAEMAGQGSSVGYLDWSQTHYGSEKYYNVRRYRLAVRYNAAMGYKSPRIEECTFDLPN